MALTYGGVPLLVPTPELAAWIESNISTADVNEFARPFWPGGVHHDWPVPTHKDANRPIKLNRLYWPRGAARWAVGHFLATDQQLTLIRRQATAGGVHAPLTLIMGEGSSTIRKISTSLYMLPARPLQQLVGVDKKQAEGLWLITLVDERYYFWERSGTVAINDGVTTWAQLYAAIGTCLGVTITADTVASEYLLPSKEFANHPQCLPLMLDAVAASVGHKIIRKLDGTVHAQGPTTAKASFTQQRPTLSPRQAGGEFAFDVNRQPTDLAALVPSSVTVKFQRKDDDVFAGASYNVQKTLASLALGDYRGITGRDATQVIHCAAVAAYTASVLGNGTELGTLASAIARDWYLWRLARLDWKAAGILPWVPEGLHDHVEWSFASGDMSTRIQRPEWNDISTATQMVGVQGSEGDVFNYYEDLYVTNLYVSNFDDITVNNLTVNNYLTYSPYEVTLTTNTTNFTINSSVVLVNLTTQNVTIENLLFSRTFKSGDKITIINTSAAYYLTLLLSGNIESYSLTEVTIGPNMMLNLVYFAADVSIPRAAGVKLYKDPCWHQSYRPSQISSNQASYSLAWSATYFDLDFSTDVYIYGFANYYPGRLFFCFNRSAQTVTIPHESSSAGTAAQRVYTQTGQTYYMGPNEGAWFQYDGNAQRWRQLTGQVRTQMSITQDSAGLKLDGDESNPGALQFYGTNGAGTKGWYDQSGITVPIGVPQWVKVTKTYTDLSTAATTNDIEVYSLPAKSTIHAGVLKTTTAFSGGGLSSYSFSVGTAPGFTDLITGPYSGTAAVSNTNFERVAGALLPNFIKNFGSATSIRLSASCDVNLNGATAGSVDLYLLVSTLP